MIRKVQIPVVGGIRKVVTVPNISVGTTIAEYGSGTITLAQLKAALGVTSGSGSTAGGNIGGSNASSIALGPGLSGGGALVGVVPIKLTAPIPVFVTEDGADGDPGPPGQRGATGAAGTQGPPGLPGDDGADGDPGPPGAAGAAGAPGTPGAQGVLGPAVWMSADDGLDGDPGPPGAAGAAGTPGTPGAQGVVGPAVWMSADDGIDGDIGPMGPRGFTGQQGVTSPATYMTGDDGDEGPIGPPGLPGLIGPAGPVGPPGFMFDSDTADDFPVCFGVPSSRGSEVINGTLTVNGAGGAALTVNMASGGASPGITVAAVVGSNNAGVLRISDGQATPHSWEFRVNQVTASDFSIYDVGRGVNCLDINSSGATTLVGALGWNNATPPAQVTGFGTPTGAAVLINFPGATATLVQCSNAIAEIYTIMKAHGMIGA